MKMALKKLVLFSVLSFTVSISSTFGQSVEFDRSGNWTYLYEVEGVNFYYKTCEYHDEYNGIHQENVVLKLENTNDTEVIVKWTLLFHYNNECWNCHRAEKPEYQAAVTIGPNTNAEGSCTRKETPSLTIFSRFLNMDKKEATLTKFILSNLQISKS